MTNANVATVLEQPQTGATEIALFFFTLEVDRPAIPGAISRYWSVSKVIVLHGRVRDRKRPRYLEPPPIGVKGNHGRVFVPPSSCAGGLKTFKSHNRWTLAYMLQM